MKPVLFLIAGLLLFAPEAGAQVIIHQAALDQLAGVSPQAAPPVITVPPAIRRLPRKITYRPVVPGGVGHRSRLEGATALAKPAPAPATPQNPAAQPVVAKPVIARPVAPAPAAAKPAAPPLPSPVVIHFAANDAQLPGDVTTALKPFCAHSGGIVTIDAYAAGNPDDPSQAPRLSMSRAFAIRDALTACGVPSGNIIPRANGNLSGKNPDAAELTASP